MNPENLGPHVPFRHTLMWRGKPMFQQKQVPDRKLCHSQLNELAQTGQLWRTRNNFIRTNFSQFRDTKSYRRTSRSFVRDSLLSEDKKQSEGTKSMIRSLRIDADKLQKSQKLVEGMANLKQMKLLSGKDLNKTQFPGIIRHQHIYNDYHWRQTNPGFSRNPMGGKMFTK